jgi:sulfur carrier protein ThiS
MPVQWNGKTVELPRPLLVSRLLENLSLSRESHLVVVNGRLATEDLRIEKTDEVKIIRVISGG